jgi:hypothetical protein
MRSQVSEGGRSEARRAGKSEVRKEGVRIKGKDQKAEGRGTREVRGKDEGERLKS